MSKWCKGMITGFMAVILILGGVAYAASASTPQPYANALQEFFSDAGGETMACLVDINGDGVDEMLAAKNLDETFTDYRFFYMNNGKLCTYDENHVDTYMGLSSNNNLVTVFAEVYYVHLLIDGELSPEAVSLSVDRDAADDMYMSNGKSITEAEYNSLLKKYGLEQNPRRIKDRSDDAANILTTATAPSYVVPVITAAASVPSGWAVDQVYAAVAAGLVPPQLQSQYTQATTRAEFCALAVTLYELLQGETITGREHFSDTKDVNVEKAAAIGVVQGVGDNKFAPNEKLTREQAATMLSRLAGALGKSFGDRSATFADNNSISQWAIDAVGQMQYHKIMEGVGNNTFSPKGEYTREQSILTIVRLYEIVRA